MRTLEVLFPIIAMMAISMMCKKCGLIGREGAENLLRFFIKNA